VRALIPLADARAESPPESWLRWLCHDAGLPPPQPQFWVQCADGSSYRLDLAWPRFKLALEYDGVAFHTGAALTRDRARQNALTAEGWTILAVTAPMLTAGRDILVAQISEQLRRAGALDR
jgi:very-short-patch-repair endonuclease